MLFNEEGKSQMGGLDGQSGWRKIVYYGDEVWTSGWAGTLTLPVVGVGEEWGMGKSSPLPGSSWGSRDKILGLTLEQDPYLCGNLGKLTSLTLNFLVSQVEKIVRVTT